jgi:hypothetical protein
LRQRRRNEGRRREREEVVAHTADTEVEGIAERFGTKRLVADAVWELSVEQQVVVLLRYYEGLEPREISDLLGVPVKTVNSRLYRAHGRLRATLDRRWGGRAVWIPLVGLLAGRRTGPNPWVLRALGAAAVVGGITVAALRAAEPPVANAEEIPTIATRTDTPRERRRPPVRPMPDSVGTRVPLAAERPMTSPAEDGWVAGRVVDLSGAAVAEVEVRVVAYERDPLTSVLRSGETLTDMAGAALRAGADEDSGFRVRGVSGVVRADGDEWVGLFGSILRVTEPRVEERVLVVAPRLRVHGLVTDDAGAGLDRVDVTWEAPEDVEPPIEAIASVLLSHATRTDTEGRFEIDVPALPGAHLTAHASGRASQSVNVSSDARRDLHFVLPEIVASANLVGHVLDSLGEPVPGAFVSTGGGVVRSDSSGRFAIDRGREQGELWATAVGLGALGVSRPRDGWPTSLELRLPVESGAITGVVVDEQDRPVAGAFVWPEDLTTVEQGRSVLFLEVLAADAEHWLHAQTDALGRFTLRGFLDRGYRLRGLDTRSFAQARSTEAFPGDDVILRIETAALSRLGGRVVAPDGAPLAGVSVYPEASLVQGAIRVSLHGAPSLTDSAGRFVFDAVASDGLQLYVSDAHLFATSAPVPRSSTSDLEITVARTCAVRVELPVAEGETLWFSLLDERGRPVPLHALESGDIRPLFRVPIRGAGSLVVNAPEVARELVLLDGVEELLRQAVDLRPGELNTLRP